ncbi:MAG: hypothetical protein AAF907_15870, partial [Planctomycetota bacterium]
MNSRVFWLAALIAAPLVHAAAFGQSGGTHSGEADDLECFIDDRWVGGQRGGYWPVRIELTNRGDDRAVTTAFLPYPAGRGGGRTPIVTKTVAAPAGQTTRFTLPIPLTSRRGDGELVIVADPLPDDGAVTPDDRDAEDLMEAAIPGLTHEVHPPAADNHAIRPPAALVVAGSGFDGTAFSVAATATTSSIEADSSRATERRSSAGTRGELLTLPAGALPETWLGWTTVDVAVISGSQLSELPEKVRDALRTWVVSGGRLVVTENPEDGSADEVEQQLSLGGEPGWTAVDAQVDLKLLRAFVNRRVLQEGAQFARETMGRSRRRPPQDDADLQEIWAA